MRGKLFLIDCGEGTQLQFRKTGLNFNKISDVFISHLHGDHCFGLMGLVSTLSLLGRTAPLRVHAHPDLESLIRPQMAYFCRENKFELQFRPFNPREYALIYEDRCWEVYSLPLIHRVASTGFLVKEKPRQPHIVKEMADFYQVPLSQYPAIKAGADFVRPDGEVVPASRLLREAETPKSYAYCSDTAYNEALVPYLQGVQLLYHEATFAQDQAAMAVQTMHSTALQAATIAQKAGVERLLIGHYSARYPDEKVLLNEARSVFPVTEAAQEGLVYEW